MLPDAWQLAVAYLRLGKGGRGSRGGEGGSKRNLFVNMAAYKNLGPMLRRSQEYYVLACQKHCESWAMSYDKGVSVPNNKVFKNQDKVIFAEQKV